MKKTIILIAAVGVIMAGVGFFSGMKYQQGKLPNGFANISQADRQRFQDLGGQASGAGGMARGVRSGGGLVSGEILSVDNGSATVKMQDGGSKIILFSNSTQIGKFTDGTVSDLVVGKNVMITGTTNTDGSVTAQSIQIRPLIALPTSSK